MSHLDNIKKLIKFKSKNVVSDKKAGELLTLIKRKFPTENLETSLQKINRYSELPSWLNDALTINETFFFRHPDQFQFLEKYLKSKKQRKTPLKIFCGGVSTGEEAYSVAFIAQEFYGDNFEVTGVDISETAISKAKEGIYHKSLIDRAPESYEKILSKYLSPLPGKDRDKYTVNDQIRSHVRFKASNIFNLPLDQYDIIFFRNILIYFDSEDKKKIFERLYSHLLGEGIFIIGAGELFPESPSKSSLMHNTSIIKKAVSYDGR